MIGTLQELTAHYTAALKDYLTGQGEQALQQAYELGRRAISEGIGVLEIATIHYKSLASVLSDPAASQDASQVVERASAFFAESLSPFEMVLRGFQEANAGLRASLRQLRETEEELQRQNRALVAAHQSVEAGRKRYQELFSFAPHGYLVTDLEGTIQEANNPAAALLRMTQQLLVGKSLFHFLAAADRETLRERLSHLARGTADKIEDWEGTVRVGGRLTIPVSVTVGVVQDEFGRRAGLRWLVSDITERKRIEEERARLLIREHLAQVETEAARRLKFLAEASTSLATSLDYATIPARIAQLLVPSLGDCCFVHLVEDDASVRHVAAIHADPGKTELFGELPLRSSLASAVPPPLAAVLQRGRAEIVPEITEAWLATFAADEAQQNILHEAGVQSALLVPLVAEGQSIGVITLGAGSGRRYTEDDLQLVEELARRFALVLENARLHSQVVAEHDEAQKASQAKDEFVAILSHELRTPLMTILGWARVLKRQQAILGDPVLNDGVRSLEHNAQNIARLVEDCLDIARISQRKVQLQKQLVDLNQITRAAMEVTRNFAQEKGLRFLIHFSPSGLWALGDRTRLEEVVSNLLTNAIKYTGAGGLVSVSLRQLEREGEIEVRDTGIGIASEFLEQIFQPFRQRTDRWLASESGLGLGLAIVQEIVRIHEGRIWAESQGLGLGSTFRVRLPLVEAPVLPLPQEPESPAVLGSTRPLRVLFIEDSRDILNLMKIELEELGFSVSTAIGAENGLASVRTERPDVIISDIKMQGMDGYEFIRQIRQMPEFVSVPAIALTGFGMKQDIERTLEAGYNAHLCKPAEPEELAALIQKLVPPETG